MLSMLAALLSGEAKGTIDTVNDVFYNPLMGFAVAADYEEAVGKNTLVYMEVSFREWEPQQGKFAVEAVKKKNNWNKWKKQGKKVVFRFVCDSPSDKRHMDIPDWLYEKTKDGTFYHNEYGKGYAPDYENQIFIEEHKKAVAQLGEVFGKDSMIAYVELGSLGHWGEWHVLYTDGVPRIPDAGVRKKYIEPYPAAFPNAKLLVRRPFAETADQGFGIYNDMTGDPVDTNIWLNWIKNGGQYEQPLMAEELLPQKNIWEKAPVGGEFTSGISNEELFDVHRDKTLSLIEKSHMTFIGPKCPILDEISEYSKGIKPIQKKLGYRYGIRSYQFTGKRSSKGGKLTLVIDNQGIAPIYFPWKMYLYVSDGEKIVKKKKIPVDLTCLCGNKSIEITMKGIPYKKGYCYGAGIENPETKKPSVYLNMKCRKKDFIYYFWETEEKV